MNTIRSALMGGTAALVLAMGTGVASAQAPEKRVPDASAPAQAAPSGEMRGGANAQGGAEMRPGGAKGGGAAGAEVQTPAGGAKAGGQGRAGMDTERRDSEPASGERREGERDRNRAEGDRPDRDGGKRAERPDRDREGRAAASTDIDISVEQRTTIRQAITSVNVAPVRDVDFSVSVGIAVPQTIELRPLPPRVVEIVPAYRSYRYFVLADGRIVIVDPGSYEIVYIIAA